MPDFGVTEAGFALKRLADIRASLNGRARSAFGPQVALHKKSTLGRLFGVFGAEQAEIWEAIGASYAAFDPNTATGAALDVVGAINRLPRLPAVHSVAEVELRGDAATVVPRRTQIEQSVTGDIWVTTEEVTLDGTGEGQAPVRSLNTGPFSAPGNADPDLATLTIIATAVTGLDSVWNPLDAQIGRNLEADVDYRRRIFEDKDVSGTNRALAVQARLRAVEGVFDALLVLNTSDETDAEGRPMRTFEAVVDGGAEADIATVLWQHKPSVIVPRHSNSAVAAGTAVTVEIEDAAGAEQSVRFTRPIEVETELTIEADVDLGSEEAAFKEALAIKFQQRQKLGLDVRHYLYQCDVAALLEEYGHDVEALTVLLAVKGEAGAAANIEIGEIEIARLETADIEVTA